MNLTAAPRAIFATERVLQNYDGPLFGVYVSGEFRWIYDAGMLKNARVAVWCDQSGNNWDAVQQDVSRQPLLSLAHGRCELDFRGNCFMRLPDGTLPSGDAPFAIIFKHGEIDNSIGGVLGSGEYQAHNAVNAIRRDGNGYVNYFWGNDLRVEGYKKDNVVAFTFSRDGQKHSAYLNGKLCAQRAKVLERYSAPHHTTIGKTYSENEYLNGVLHFLYICDEPMPYELLLRTGQWRPTGF